ncbi:MAG: hypothetical protein A2Z14_05250 [Chloroflexi bacterium RBG_16_48_8]|nr:MAG: hypothetical protein A2Z14_05250 [Chloroflexi bacterium RBG_16_48_8]
MIRPFDWRDLVLLHRVRDQGLCLDSQLAFTRGSNTIQTLLLDIITPRRTACTFVVRPDEKEDQEAIGQILHRTGEPHARLSFFGPVGAISSPGSGRLLDALSHAAGERGAQHLIAEVDEQSPIFELIRKAGFAIYARQRIWRLQGKPDLDPFLKSTDWRVETDDDESAINHLYLDIVPALVQQVELPPRVDRGGLVHWREGELLGYLDIERGPLGVWLDPFFHPAVENLDELLAGFLASYSDNQNRPLYFPVRSYQGWIGHALERIGFEICSDQAVMVKRLAVAIRKPALSSLSAVERTHPEPTTPFAHLCQSWPKIPAPPHHE